MSFSEPCALAVDFGGTSIKMGVTAGERILAVKALGLTGKKGSSVNIFEVIWK